MLNSNGVAGKVDIHVYSHETERKQDCEHETKHNLKLEIHAAQDKA